VSPTRVASLCSGYGGIELGLELAGVDVEVVWHAEYDDAPALVHGKHWPAPNLGDITRIDWDTCEPVDLLTAGYPCQPFSHAGRRQGVHDERHLWPHVAQAVRSLRPRLVFLENVAGHLTLGFDVVCADLAQMGYRVRWGCVRASDAGAPHRRERLFIAADTDEPGLQGPQPAQRRDVPARRGGAATDTRSEGTGRDDRAVPGEVQGREDIDVRAVGDDRGPATDTCCGGQRTGAGLREGQPERERWRRPGDNPVSGDDEPSAWGPFEPAIRRWEHITRPAPAPTDDRGRLSPVFVEWMMGLPAGWVTDHGLPRTAELKMLGNGVVPQAAAIAWRELVGGL
jgi:DNA (cytosine-5)-methyltransferase 1